MQSFIIFIALLFFTACSGDSNLQKLDLEEVVENVNTLHTAKEPDVYYVGFDLRAEPQEDIAQYMPLLKYLHKETGLKFKLFLTPEGSSTEDELCLGHTDFSFIGALSFMKAHAKCNVQPVVQGLNSQDMATYRSMFIVKKGSRIKGLQSLKGVRFAFGSKNSTQGYLIPRSVLKDEGIGLKDFKKYTLTGSHHGCAEAVLSGAYDVCSLQDTLAEKLAKEGLVDIIYKSTYYPSSLLASREDIPTEDIEKIKKALLSFEPLGKDKDSLYHWDKTEMPHGFKDTNINADKLIHKLAIDIGIIDPTHDYKDEK